MRSRSSNLLFLLLAVGLNAMCGPPALLAPPSSYRSTADAVRAYQDALGRDPDDAKAHLWLGMIMIQEGNREEGIPHLYSAKKADPSLTEAFVALGRQLEIDGKYPEALALYDEGIRGNDAVRHVVERKHDLEQRRASALNKVDIAWALMSQGKPEDALDLLRAIPAELPDIARVHELTARAAVDIAKSLLTYDDRKALMVEAQAAITAAVASGSPNVETLSSVVDSLRAHDEEHVAQAREKVEEGGQTFMRDICLSQRAPLLTVTNRRAYDVTLDVHFLGGASQSVVINDQVAMRSSPSRDADRVALLPRGTAVWPTRQGPEDYVYVMSAIGEGWVAGSMIDRASFVSFTIRAGSTLRVVLNPGSVQFRLGRGMRSLAEGTEEFLPYLCYSWE
ncbi:tetratricopeptide repeat protein [Candidatus Fermentibacteria bacterium]|nr:tetratricopeptide repeat protein [Candidatus Fermentibacteria bacterium]